MSDHKIVEENQQAEEENEESRQHERKPCYEDTHFLTHQKLHEGVIRNISKGGTYIETEDFFFSGQEITVAGPFEEDGSDVKQKGEVVRCDGRGIGVKFVKPGS